jgi:hypothetical protein
MSGVLSGVMSVVSGVSKVDKAAKTTSKVMYIGLMILAIILIAIGAGVVSSNITAGIILMFVGGGFGFLGYSLMPSSE